MPVRRIFILHGQHRRIGANVSFRGRRCTTDRGRGLPRKERCCHDVQTTSTGVPALGGLALLGAPPARALPEIGGLGAPPSPPGRLPASSPPLGTLYPPRPQ